MEITSLYVQQQQEHKIEAAQAGKATNEILSKQ